MQSTSPVRIALTCLFGALALSSQSSRLSVRAGQTAVGTSTLVRDALQARIRENGCVRPINKYDFVPFVLSVFRDEIGVQDFAVRERVVRSSFGDGLSRELQVHLPGRVAGVSSARSVFSVMRPSVDSLSDHEHAVFRAVAQGSRSVKSGRMVNSRGDVFLSPLDQSRLPDGLHFRRFRVPGFANVFVNSHGVLRCCLQSYLPHFSEDYRIATLC